MKRWHQEYYVFHRQWKKYREMHVDSNKNWTKVPGRDPYEVDCVCDYQVGKFRKKDAYDCGSTKCSICHSDKFPKRSLSNKEIASNISFKEQLKEIRYHT